MPEDAFVQSQWFTDLSPPACIEGEQATVDDHDLEEFGEWHLVEPGYSFGASGDGWLE
jgi:hypothetical protein